MVPYFLIFIVLLSLALFEQFYSGKCPQPLKILVFIILVLFAALRPDNIDKDYASYRDSFESFGTPGEYFTHYLEWAFYEPLYYLIPSFIKTYISNNWYVPITFMLFAVVGVSLKFVGIRKLSNYYFLSVFCYFCYYFMMHEMTTIRAGIAAGIMFLAIPKLYSGKYWHVLLMTLIALLFHFSAIFILPLMLLSKEQLNIKFYSIILIITFALAFFDTSFIFSLLQFDLGPLTLKSNNYKDLAEKGELTEINRLNMFFLANFAVAALCIVFSKKIFQANKYAILICKIQIWGLFCFQFLSGIPVLAFRVSDFLLTVSVICFTYLLEILPNKWVGFTIALAFSIGLFLLNLFYVKLLTDYNI